VKFVRQFRYRLEQGWSFIEALNITNWVSGLQAGKHREQQRIIKEWDNEMSCDCETPMPHLLERIKGEK
jgi:hypothetical protein